MLSIYQECFSKAIIRRISKFPDKYKKGFRRNFRRSWSITKIYRMSTTIFSFDPEYIRLLCVKCPWEGGRFNHFKYFENHKSYVNEFLHYQYSKRSDSYLRVQSILLVSADFCLLKG